MIERTDVTYGQLDRVLRSLGLVRLLVATDPPAVQYEHEAFGTLISLPPFPEGDRVLDYHLIAVQTMLDKNGIVDSKAFAAELQKAG